MFLPSLHVLFSAVATGTVVVVVAPFAVVVVAPLAVVAVAAGAVVAIVAAGTVVLAASGRIAAIGAVSIVVPPSACPLTVVVVAAFAVVVVAPLTVVVVAPFTRGGRRALDRGGRGRDGRAGVRERTGRRLHLTEPQLRGLADERVGLGRVLHAGQVDHDVVALALTSGSAIPRPSTRLRMIGDGGVEVDRSEPFTGSEHDRRAALEVEPEHRATVAEHRRDERADDHDDRDDNRMTLRRTVQSAPVSPSCCSPWGIGSSGLIRWPIAPRAT